MTNDTTTVSGAMPDEFDRLLGQLDGLSGVSRTRETTITVTPPLGIGGSRTFIVQTMRQRETALDVDAGRSRDTVFLQMVSGAGSFRVALPFQVADAIARQRDALSTQSRKAAGRANAPRLRQLANERIARGEKPAFLRRRRAGAKK